MRHKNLIIESPNQSEAFRLYEEYKSLGFYVTYENTKVTVHTLQPRKAVKKKDDDREKSRDN